MNKTLMAWTTAALLGVAALAPPSLAQTTPAGTSAAGTGAGSTAAGKAVKSETRAAQHDAGAATRKYEADHKAAEAACHSRKGADQESCLKAVRAQHRQSRAEIAGKTGAVRKPESPGAVPALQTQSSAVGATGIAPSTTGPDPTPGTTAVPRN